MAPIVHGIEQDYSGQINVIFLDSDDDANDRFKDQLGFIGMPTYILVDGEGNVVKRWAGRTSEQSFSTAIDALLAGEPIP